MAIRLNVHDLHALARQFRHSHQQISDLMHRLNRHLQVLLSSVTAAKTSAIDQAQTDMEHEIKGYLHTLDDLEHLLSHTEARMIKTDQLLAAAISKRRTLYRLSAHYKLIGISAPVRKLQADSIAFIRAACFDEAIKRKRPVRPVLQRPRHSVFSV